MIIAYGVNEIILDDGQFWWSDELDYETITQIEEYSVCGSLIVEPIEVLGARKMTLEPTGPQSGWLDLATWKTLSAWSKIKGQAFVATFANDDTFNVICTYPFLTAKPIHGFSRRDDTEFWRGSLHFIIQE